MPLRIRRGREADLEVLLDLWASLAREMDAMDRHLDLDEDFMDKGRRYFRENLGAEDFLSWLAEDEGEAVGFLCARVERPGPIFVPRPWLHIMDLYVRPPYRRQGVGRALMEGALGWARERGLESADLSVYSENPARGLYEDLGFVPYRVIMRKELGRG
mgnify:FL=1